MPCTNWTQSRHDWERALALQLVRASVDYDCQRGLIPESRTSFICSPAEVCLRLVIWVAISQNKPNTNRVLMCLDCFSWLRFIYCSDEFWLAVVEFKTTICPLSLGVLLASHANGMAHTNWKTSSAFLVSPRSYYYYVIWGIWAIYIQLNSVRCVSPTTLIV